MRRLALCLVSLSLVMSSLGAAVAQNLTWVDPNQLPAPLGQPLKLLATTGKSGVGQDYFLLKPGQSATIGTVSGPAVIARVWSTSSKNASVRLEMTLDGKKQIVYDRGKLPTSAATSDPLRALDKQAYWSYLPLAVRQKAVFTATNYDKAESIRFYLQVGYRPVSSDQLKLVSNSAIETLRREVSGVMQSPAYGLTGLQRSSGQVANGQAWTLSTGHPFLVRELTIKPDQQATVEQLNATRLTLTVDGSRCVDVPLGALFCQYWKLADYTSVATAVEGQNLILRFPLPVGQSLQVSLESFGSPSLSSATLTACTQPLKQAPKYVFCAQYFSQISVQEVPLSLLSVQGPGLYVGSNLATDGRERKTFAFLEGNEQMWVDVPATATAATATSSAAVPSPVAGPAPTLEGTGTEDYFNNAWYFEAGTLARAFHGVTFKQDHEPPRVSAYRYMIPDCVPFKSSFRLELQHGSRNRAPNVLYSGVVFWYQQLPVTITPPANATPPAATGRTAIEGTRDLGWVWPSTLGLVILIVFVGGAAFLMMHRRRQS